MFSSSLQVKADHFFALPGKISEMTRFEEQWRAVFGVPEAHRDKEIVYIWTTAAPIPRLRGSSNIIYIGKTVNSIQQRHLQYARIEANGERNRPRYAHILEHFGPIRFHIGSYKHIANDLKSAEKKLLQMYFEKHLEYPPLNRMGK